MQNKKKIILGIDPGTVVMGFGLIAIHNKEITLVDMGVLKAPAKMDAYERLENIYKKVSELILLHHPESFAIEAPFFGKNVQSMLKLGRAQGVAIAAAMQAGLSVTEYSPKKVKQSITGNGNASKEQVLKMLQRMLKFEEEPAYFDATDALSVAVCHHFQDNPLLMSQGKKVKDWKDFISQNPGRISRV
ncbi:MAG: crossover junction endodeoxyribonuclease RuvC [Gloeobacteraceae cyanobacterium ES-bin-316]|nr:crossover junction endodeoxyribonuclease RuvC [Ferruginibacter sp.]